MIRVGEITVAAGLLITGTSMAALAQGVPTVDGTLLGRLTSTFLEYEADEVMQRDQMAEHGRAMDFERQQLETLDEMISAFSSVSTVGPAFISGTASVDGIEAVYGPTANPSGQLLFGGAREDIEQIIIRGTADTYHLAGVARAGLSPVQWRCLIQALIWQESRFQIGARSPAAAYGLTQIIPGTAQYLGIYPDYYDDPYLQVVGGARYFAEQLERFDGIIVHALAAYNAGPGRVIEYGGVPPFKETQHYVQVIPAKYNSYLAAVGGPDALGTLDPSDYALANASLTSMGSIQYASNSLTTAGQALQRVRAFVDRIGSTDSIKESYDLNTAIRAELILILAGRLRTKAARTQAKHAQVALQLARQRAAMEFITFTQPEL